jgi:membrane protease YdiL (CAAX protease family)
MIFAVAVRSPDAGPSWRTPVRRVLHIWNEIHEETIDRERRTFDYRPVVVFLLVAVSLTLQEYFGDRGYFRSLEILPKSIRTGANWELWSYAWWSGWRVFGFLVLPTLAVLCMPGERLRDYFWSVAGFTRHIRLYLVLYALVLPLVFVVSRTTEFRHIYPFYRQANRSLGDFWAWELMYAAQFVSLEFFFRGFMLKATKSSIGVYSIFAMVVPYCMIHYGKTFVECIAAIIAGTVLGTIALRTRSIWGGIFVHVAVAWTMDLLTVGYLPKP